MYYVVNVLFVMTEFILIKQKIQLFIVEDILYLPDKNICKGGGHHWVTGSSKFKTSPPPSPRKVLTLGSNADNEWSWLTHSILNGK